MGRLFWKFFFSILLAQLAATFAIGGAFWLKNREAEQVRRSDIDTSPPAEMAIEAAAATLAYGGPSGLQQMLENMPHHRVYAVDDSGKELLGRIVNPAMLSEAQKLMDKGDQRVVRHVTSGDGKRYLLFLPSRDHLRGMEGSRMLLAGAGIPVVDLPGMRGARERHPPPPDGDRPPPDRAHPLPAGPDAGGPGAPGGPDGRPPRFRPLTPWIPLAAAVLASLLFAALLAWYFSRPIRSLRDAFEAASQGELEPRFGHTSKRGDELNALGHDFDRMTARLRNLIDGQTRLLHDVSHELRSPLARLQAAIGLAHQQPEKMRATMERIERESMRMDKLVGGTAHALTP
ncbi:HAMP domain-containing protein [Pseudoduganella sp. UC29_106]|uniref:HAMP domain-containing protein n=1 Tax=Pseudoduganella sp. UC29_106 TaxID=3374553 RepID=UPI003756A1D4